MGNEDPDKLDYLAIVLFANGRRADADAALQALVTQRAATDAVDIAAAYAYENDRDLALHWLERAYAQRDVGLLEITGEPLLKNVADDPRFFALMSLIRQPHQGSKASPHVSENTTPAVRRR
jgi:hypothetical protein